MEGIFIFKRRELDYNEFWKKILNVGIMGLVTWKYSELVAQNSIDELSDMLWATVLHSNERTLLNYNIDYFTDIELVKALDTLNRILSRKIMETPSYYSSLYAAMSSNFEERMYKGSNNYQYEDT